MRFLTFVICFIVAFAIHTLIKHLTGMGHDTAVVMAGLWGGLSAIVATFGRRTS